MNKHRITVLGSNFAALTAVRTLRRASKDLILTVISPRAEFLYYAGLIWIPSGLRTKEDLCLDLTNFFKRLKIQHIAAEVINLQQNGRIVETNHKTEKIIENDGLIIATGGRFLKKLPGIEHAILPCEGITAAETLRDRIKNIKQGHIAFGFATNPQEQSLMRGGPIFEFLFGLDNQLKREKRRENFQLKFFTPAERPGNRLGPRAADGLLAEMKRRDIQTHLGHKLKGFTKTQVLTEGGDFPADLIVFMPGLTGSNWFDQTTLPRSPGGLIQGDTQCRVPGFAKVYVAGDAGSFPGPDWMPKQGHMADLQGAVAARNLLTELNGNPPSETFRNELICIMDTGKDGMLVGRTEKRSFILPRMRLLHWVKQIFEWFYLRRFR